MNIKAIAKAAIRACITEDDIKEAVYTIVSENIDMETALAENKTLQKIVDDELYEAIEEEVRNYT